ncbi:MAG: hypothetical protein LBK94_09875 [Prevotellaceae bacterium]|nr:hypothetical protein [Prevotellaceae bacterium]
MELQQIIDITPMIIQKLPKYSTIAAFVYFFFISIIIVNIDLPHIPWWLEGGLISFALMIPVLIHVGHTDKKPLPVIASTLLLSGL